MIQAYIDADKLESLFDWCEMRTQLYESTPAEPNEPGWMHNQRIEIKAILKGLVNSSLVNGNMRGRAKVLCDRLRKLEVSDG